MASSYHKVSILSPFVPIAISYNPVFGVVYGIYAPSQNHNRVIQILPSFTLVDEGLISDIFGWFCFFFLSNLIENFEAFTRNQTFVVSSENIGSLKFGI